jgi:hypothetical protein
MAVPGFSAGLSIYSPDRYFKSQAHGRAPVETADIIPQGGMAPGLELKCTGCLEGWPNQMTGCSYNQCCLEDRYGNRPFGCQLNFCGCRFSASSLYFRWYTSAFGG